MIELTQKVSDLTGCQSFSGILRQLWNRCFRDVKDGPHDRSVARFRLRRLRGGRPPQRRPRHRAHHQKQKGGGQEGSLKAGENLRGKVQPAHHRRRNQILFCTGKDERQFL